MAAGAPYFCAEDSIRECECTRRWRCLAIVRSGGPASRGLWARFVCQDEARALLPDRIEILHVDEHGRPSRWKSPFRAATANSYDALLSDVLIPQAARDGAAERYGGEFMASTLTIEIFGRQQAATGEYPVLLEIAPSANLEGRLVLERLIRVLPVGRLDD